MFIQIIGRLGKDAELKTSQSGSQFLTYSVAFDEYNFETKQNETIWLNVTDGTEWSKKQMKFLTKGRMLNLVGDYKTSIFNSQTGPKIDHKFRTLSWNFVSGGKQQEAETQSTVQATVLAAPSMGKFVPQQPQVVTTPTVTATDASDDLPF